MNIKVRFDKSFTYLKVFLDKFFEYLKVVLVWPAVAIIILVVYHSYFGSILNKFSDSLTKVSFGQLSFEVASREGDAAKIKETFENKTFTGEKIVLDFKAFRHCKFSGCELVYLGRGPVELSNNQISSSRFLFAEEAARTLVFLSKMHKGGGDLLVENILADIRSGKFGGPMSTDAKKEK